MVALLSPVRGFAAMQATDKTWDGSEPPQGIYFHWYEPSFYTGFAPRTQDPTRVHIELSRGNQVRFTMVLGDIELDNYLDDLAVRHKTYQELVDAKVINLTTNKEYDRFVEGLDHAGVANTLAQRASLGPDAYRQKSAEIMSTLNPNRIFHIHMPLDRVLAAWHDALTAADLSSPAGRLDAANAILPGRIDLYELKPDVAAALDAAAAAARAGKADDPAFRDKAVEFLDKATQGHYRVRDGAVDAVEFTAIYPAGTIQSTTTYNGETLPAFGVTGVWPLIPRTNGRGMLGMVDYISPNPGYGFITMLPYQYAGGIEYNAFHNAGVRCELGATPFLPAAWRKVVSVRDGKPYQNLWIPSRGPTSHGCTRLGSGHVSELRNSLPASSKVLQEVPTFRNLVQCYDVFDIDGTGAPRAMGVQYYLAYKNTDHTPVAAYVANKRTPFYQWMYGDNIDMAPVGQAKLKQVPICRFVGLRKAEEARVATNVPLYKAEWAPESIQFYTLKPAAFDSDKGFEFNRELRKVGAGYTADRGKLFLR